MMRHPARSRSGAAPTEPPCPPWCVNSHGVHEGEEDWVHMSAPLAVTGQDSARLCVTVHPDGAQEAPVLLIGSEEYTLAEASALGSAIIDLAAAGRTLIAPAST